MVKKKNKTVKRLSQQNSHKSIKVHKGTEVSNWRRGKQDQVVQAVDPPECHPTECESS